MTPARLQKGFTLIELLISISLLIGIVTGVAFSALSVRQKAILTRDTDFVFGMLEFARQQSLVAYKGEAYSVVFDDTNISVQPGTQSRNLDKTIDIYIEPDTNIIKFNKLNGRSDQPYTITLRQGKFVSIINVETTGLVSLTPIGLYND